MKEIYCPACNIEMEFHPVTADFMGRRFGLQEDDHNFTGILDEFYSCPECGRTIIPAEALYAQPAMPVYSCDQAVAMELF